MKILMMVDNTIDGDSRVQKSARSMAEAGYDVTLLGRAPSSTPTEAPLGKARMRRVPVPFLMEAASRRTVGFSPRHPLAYPTAEQMTMRQRAIDARRLQRLTTSASGAATSPVDRVGGAWNRGLRGLHALRSRQYRAAVQAATPDDSPQHLARAQRAQRRLGNDAWRVLEPRLLDYEVSFAPVIDQLRPDVLHAHDFRMIGVAVRAAQRLRSKGHQVRVVYDAHEFLPGVGGPSQYWQIAHETYEAAHIHQVDGVVAVSDEMAERIQQQHGLPVRPTVVMNCPPATSGGGSGDLRTRLGLGPDVPILVYVGVAAAKRGVTAAVRSLPLLPGVHMAMMSKPSAYVDEMRKLAADLGVTDRLHVVGYVPVDDVVSHISTATLGMQGLVHLPNHEVTIATKYFDYAWARLPLVCSDVEAMAALTRATGNGEVFRADDHESFAQAVSTVLADLPGYRAAYDREGLLDAWTWEAQAATLATFYERMLALPQGTPVPTVPTAGR